MDFVDFGEIWGAALAWVRLSLVEYVIKKALFIWGTWVLTAIRNNLSIPSPSCRSVIIASVKG